MKLHRNAATCPKSRALIAMRVLEEGWTRAAAAEAAGVSVKTVRKWVDRAQAGEPLGDRSSAPRRIPHRTPQRVVRAIEALRRLRMTAAEIAEVLGVPLSTVSAWLKRVGLGKRSRLEPPEPPNRYERRRPGELVHIDIKQLGRIGARGAGHRMIASRKSQGSHARRSAGFEYVHVMIDDHSRLAYAEVLEGLRAEHAIAFLRRALAWFSEQGVEVKAVMSDNGPCYLSREHRAELRELGLRHLLTRPYRPRTNGKAERFIQTLLDEWAYHRIYASSSERTAALAAFLQRYNFRRPHGSLGKQAPATRVHNLARNYT
jgi:transposase InsO family protein